MPPMLTINPMITTNGSIKPSGLSLVKANRWFFLVFISVGRIQLYSCYQGHRV